MVWLFLACAVPTEDSADACAEPLYTWESWGAGFFGSYCRACHSADTPDRRGAPEGVDFDTESQVRSFSAAITRSITEGTMPIGGGVPDADLARLEAWLACGDGGDSYAPPPIVAEFTAEEAQAAGERVLESVPTISFGLHDWLVDLLDDLGGGSGCPDPQAGTDEGDWTLYWTGDCDGARVALHGDIIAYSEVSSDTTSDSVWRWDLFSLTGQTVEGGEDVFAGGNTLITWSETEGAASLKVSWGGAYGDPSSDGPLAVPFSGGVEVAGGYHPVAGFKGTVAGAMSTDGAALDVRSLTIEDGLLTGSLAIRDPSSGWWVVELPEDGSGCGPLTFEGETFGESCLAHDVAEDLDAELAEYWAASR